MSSNLAAIGFAFTNAAEFQDRMLQLAADTVERLDCAAGDCAIWRSRTGAEIWFHLPVFAAGDSAHDIAGLTPFFEGASEVALEITQRLTRPDDNAFEGAFVANLARAGLPGGHRATLTFDAVDFAAHEPRPLPLRCHARLTGFARSVRLVAADEAAPRAGFGTTSDGATRLGGSVVEIRQLTNEVTGGRFAWLQLDCAGTAFDIVADQAILADHVTTGARVDIACALFGRLID